MFHNISLISYQYLGQTNEKCFTVNDCTFTCSYYLYNSLFIDHHISLCESSQTNKTTIAVNSPYIDYACL